MSPSDDLLFLTGTEIRDLLDGREQGVLNAVREAYILHHRGESALPHSVFLQFPEGGRDRVIGLPAYLGGAFGLAGMKWIASMPGNVDLGMDRASAAMILNDRRTGRPKAFLEASCISAQRTAASAALAAQILHTGEPTAVSLVGCGLIGFQVVRYLREVWPRLTTVFLRDLQPERSAYFSERLEEIGMEGKTVGSLEEALAAAPVTIFATTAIVPHVDDLSSCPPGATILHVSLRDLVPELIPLHDNVVDDLDHVCRARTSIHLAAEEQGHTRFVRASLGALLDNEGRGKESTDALTIFSPFGLGILDLAVAGLVCEAAAVDGVGRRVEGFLPAPWMPLTTCP